MARPPPNPGSSSGLHFLNSPFGDTTFTKVFVGGLAWETSSETLGRHFEQFGEILEAVVITDKNSGRSKGYGFVTFLYPEAARRACGDPSPVIDGRRANCNLASLKRTWPGPGYARMRPAAAVPFIGSAPPPQGAFVGASYPQQQIPYGYQQGFIYPPYGFMNYEPEYAYPQNIYGAYPGQQYLQMYGAPGTASPAVYPFGQLSQHIPSGHGYPTAQGYGIPSQQLMQFSGPNLNGAAAAPMPTTPASYPQGVAVPTPQPFFMVPAHSSQFTQGSGSEQNTVQKEP